jgi:RNA polymerase sigma-70 factor, ECF subfamily
MYAAGAEQWRKVKLDPAVYAQHVGQKLPADAKLPEGLAELEGADLYLACACALGRSEAISAFDQAFLPKITAALATVDKSPSFIEEAQQFLRHRLLVSDGRSTPRIADYSGRGPLGSWVRAAAVRSAINMYHAAKREVPLDDGRGAGLDLPGGDPEIDFLKQKYRQDFKTSFEEALEGLSSQDRTVLRLHLIDGLSVEQIGAMYKANKSTVYRWMAKARDTLLRQTKKILSRRLGLQRHELDSLMGLVRSQLDVSLTRFLKDSKD